MQVISFRPEIENLDFLNKKISGFSKSTLINNAIKNYRIYLLRKKLREGFSKQSEDDLKLANSDISDYISIIENQGI